ncbi:MAG TPA: NADP-dependent oxidoreductase [Thermoanaerobaculia bacterium]|jgi:NADPH:quinone reductase-like Zn-dependent oxidoreductase
MIAILVLMATVGSTMKAVQIQAFGGPEVLRVERVARPVAGPGELLVRVHAASVNPVDTYTRAGETAGITGATLPYTPGFDVSGVVEAAGDGVKSFKKGDAVFAMLDLRRGGGYAEYVIVKEAEAARKPQRMTHEQAAAIPLTALTAWQALFDTAKLEKGQTVLIHAGAGGVGTMAVQLAKWKGARVIATASASNHEYLKKLGADEVIDYRTQKFEELVKGVDVVLDLVGGETQQRSLGVLRDGGTLVSIVGLGGTARRATNITAKAILVKPNGEQLARIAELVTPTVSHTFPLDKVQDAHVQSETGRTRGKIVLKVAE